MVKHTNSSFKIQFINITKRIRQFLFLMIHWLVISGINLSELKKMSLILHFFQNIHRKKKWIWKTVWHQIVCTWLFKSSRWRYSAKIGFLQNRCSAKYQVDHVVKILGKCLWKSSFLVKLKVSSLQLCLKLNSFTGIFHLLLVQM